MPTAKQEYLLTRYAKIVAQHDKERDGKPGDLNDRIYREEHAPFRALLREYRLACSIPICWGSMDCLNEKLLTCVGGHQVCETHEADCFTCKAEKL
jgi:hypothetical protein